MELLQVIQVQVYFLYFSSLRSCRDHRESRPCTHAQSFQLVLAVYLDTLSFELCQLWVVATGNLVSQTFQPQRSHVTQLGECVAGDEVDHGDPNELSH